jgi:hypothetical protein
MTYFDFNSASEQTSFDLIPKGTLVRVRMTIRPGGFDDASQGWRLRHPQRQHRFGLPELRVRRDGGVRPPQDVVADRSAQPQGSGVGQHGSHLRQGDPQLGAWVHPGDNSPAAQNSRRISGFADLDGIEFLGKVDWEKDQNGQDKSVIKAAITPDHKDYAALMGGARQPAPAANAPSTPTPMRRPPAGHPHQAVPAGRSNGGPRS